MEFDKLYEEGTFYNSSALIWAIEQIKDYKNTTYNTQDNLFKARRYMESVDQEKEIFKELKRLIEKDKPESLRGLKKGVWVDILEDKKNEIYECVLSEIEKIINNEYKNR